jgi:hypothetical protein
MNAAEVQQLIANAVQQSQAHLTAQMEQAATIAQLDNQLLGNNGTQHDAEHNNGSGTELVQNQPMSFSGQETSTLRFPKPEKFTGKRSDDVANWLFTMDNLFSAQTHFTQSQMVAYATSCLTEEALSWWQVARITGEEQPKTWEALKEAMRAYFESPTKV